MIILAIAKLRLRFVNLFVEVSPLCYVPGKTCWRQAGKLNRQSYTAYARAHKRLKTWYLAFRPGMGRSCRISTSGQKDPYWGSQIDYVRESCSNFFICTTKIKNGKTWYVQSWILDPPPNLERFRNKTLHTYYIQPIIYSLKFSDIPLSLGLINVLTYQIPTDIS